MAIDLNRFRSAPKPSSDGFGALPSPMQTAFPSYIDVSKAPKPLTQYKPKPGVNYFDVIATDITNPMNPSVFGGKMRIGDLPTYGVSVVIHRGNAASGNKPHICLKNNYGRPCTRCEEYFLPPEKGGTFQKGVQKSGNQNHAITDRLAMLVVPRIDKHTPGNELQWFDAPLHKTHGFPILRRAREMGNGESPVMFWFPEDGKTIQFTATPGEFANSMEYTDLFFLDRDPAVGAALYEKFTFPLDSLLIVPTKDEMDRDLFGGAGAAHANGANFPKTEDEGGMDPDAFGAPVAEVPKAVEAPKAPAPMATPAPVAEAPKAEGNDCPYGHTFGKDWDKAHARDNCKTCEKQRLATHDACMDAS
jgi:hypothetical protein